MSAKQKIVKALIRRMDTTRSELLKEVEPVDRQEFTSVLNDLQRLGHVSIHGNKIAAYSSLAWEIE